MDRTGRRPLQFLLIRALDEGGMVWEGDAHYETVDEALDALESALAEWMEQNA